MDGSVLIDVDMNVSEAEKEIAKLKKNILKLEKDISDATAKREKAQKTLTESSLATEREKLFNMKAAYKMNEDVQKRLDSLLKKAYEVELKVMDAEKKEAPILERIAVVRKSIAAQVERINEMQKGGGVSNEDLQEAKRSLNGMLEQRRAYTREIEEIEFTNTTNRNDLASLNEEIDKVTSSIPAIVPTVEELDAQKRLVSGLQSEWNKAEKDIQRYNDKIEDATAGLIKQKIYAGELQEKIDETNANISQMAVADKRIVNLNRELLDLKQRQEYLESMGIGLGYEEYDRNTARISAITEELKKYSKTLQETATSGESLRQRAADLTKELSELKQQQKELEGNGVTTDYSEYFQNAENIAQITQELQACEEALQKAVTDSELPLQDEHLQEVSENVQEIIQRIEELNRELDELQGEKAALGWGLGAKDEAQELRENISAVIDELSECEDYLDSLAESGDLGKIAGGSEIAERRIEELTQELEDLEAQQKEMELLSHFGKKSKAEYGELLEEIEQVNYLLEAYRQNLSSTPGESASLSGISEDAEAAKQHIADLNQRLQELKERQKELEEQGVIEGYEEYYQNAERIAEITEQLEEYEKALKDVKEAGKEEAQERLNAYLEKSNSLYQKLRAAIDKTSEASTVLNDLAETTSGSFSDAFQTASEAAGAFSTQLSGVLAAAGPYLAVALAVIPIIKKIASAVMEFGKQATQSMILGTKAVANFAISGAQSFVELLKSIGKFSSSAIKAISGLTKEFLAFAKNFNVFSKLTDALYSKIKRLGQMIRRVFVFSILTSGLRAIRTQVSAYLKANTEFMTALRRLQGVLLTAFQPIYEVIVPALTTLINVLTRAAATVTQFFASMFGTTAKQAQANAKNLYEQANATTAAGKAAEKASKQFTSFDEIEKLNGENETGGGGAASVDMGPLFDYEYDETPFDSWGEAFSSFLDKLLAGIPKLRDAFEDFSDWFNGLNQKLYDMFTFPGVLDKVKQLGRDLADAFNYLVDLIDWELWGRALGAGLNLGLNFLTSFLYGFDWMDLGHSLAEFVNGLADEIDWYEFGRLLWAGFKIALETLAGFILGLDMPLIAEAASNIILGFFDEMKNTIDRIPWGEIGTQIATFLNNIKWYDIITHAWAAISAGINALFAMVRGFIDELHWDDIATQIYTAINDSIGLIEWAEIGQTIGDAFKHVFDFLRTIINGINWHQIGEDIAAFILSFDWVGAIGGLADLIAAGINAAVQFACGMLDVIEPEAFNIARGISERIRNAIESVEWDKLGEVVGRAIKTALSFVAGLLDPETFYSIGKAIGDFLVNLDWPGIVGGLAEVLANAINSAVAAVKGFLSSVKPRLKEIADDIAEKINQFVKDVDWKEFGKTIHDGIEAGLDFLLEILDQLDWDSIGDAIADFFINLDWGGLMEKWGTIVGRAMGDAVKAIDLGDLLWLGAQLIDGMGQGMMNKWDESGDVLGWLTRLIFKPFIDAFQSLFGIHSPSTVMAEQGGFLIAGLHQGMTDAWGTITEFFSEKLEDIKKTLSEAWENIKETAKEKFEEVKEKIGEVWDNLKQKTAETWNSIKSTLSETWNGLKEAASTAFTAIKDKIGEAWDNIKAKTSEIWNGIKTALSEAWENLKTAAKEKFDAIKQKISEVWDGIKQKTGEIWNNIKTSLSEAWENLKSTAAQKFEEIKAKISDVWENVKSATSNAWENIKSTVSNAVSEIWSNVTQKFSEIISAAKSWGSDICQNISRGINGAMSKVTSAAKGVANGIKDFLGFSEPKKGPLSNFHTYMPDMLELMSDGIRGNAHLATSAASDLAKSIADSFDKPYTLGNISVAKMPNISDYTIPAIAKGAAIPANREFTEVVNQEYTGGNSQIADIESAVVRAMRSAGMSGGGNITVIMEIDGREFGRVSYKYGNQEHQRVGVHMTEVRS